MEDEQLVQLVTAEVMRRLGRLPQNIQQQPPRKKVRALVIFTGGTIGLEQSFYELKELQQADFEFSVVLSVAAEQIISIARVQAELGREIPIITSAAPYPGKRLREAELIIVPVLTQNTAAKLASTQADNLCTTLIMQALMMGKPVIAATNAADPNDTVRSQLGMGKASPRLMQALRSNLQTLDLYGMKLVVVNNLARASREIQNRLDKEVQTKAVSDKAVKRTVLTATAVQAAYSNGKKQLAVPQGMIITPLAFDVARDCHIELVRDE